MRKHGTSRTQRTAAIERLRGAGSLAKVMCDEHSVREFDRTHDFDYFMVRTDEFAPIAPKDSVIEVFMDERAKGEGAILVVGPGRLELRPHHRAGGVQVLGKVTQVMTWPGVKLRHYEP